MAGSVRKRGMRVTKEVVSPYDHSAVFTIRKANNREDVERQNMFSKVRTVQNLGTPNELIMERDIPMGQVQVDTILLCTDDWTLVDDNGETYPITEENLLEFLKPAERRWLYEEILELNPIWKGEDEEKEDSGSSSIRSLNGSSQAGS